MFIVNNFVNRCPFEIWTIYDSIIICINDIGGVMGNVLVSSVVDGGFNLGSVQTMLLPYVRSIKVQEQILVDSES